MSSLKEKRLGEENISKQGYKMKVIEYKDANNIVVEFECGFKTPTSYRSFESGSLKYPKTKQQFKVQTYVKPKDRQGLTNYNTQGYKMTILEYNTSENITVAFEDGAKVYGPETCVFLPHSINQMFKTSRAAVRNGIPKGIRKIGNSYSASYRTKRLGTSPTMEGAFLKYKKAKEQHIQEITANFRPYLPFKIINALETYRVELDDK